MLLEYFDNVRYHVIDIRISDKQLTINFINSLCTVWYKTVEIYLYINLLGLMREIGVS